MSYLDKLAKVEALIQRASSEGERHAAQLAKERILGKISDLQLNRPIEYKLSFDSPWKKRLFVTLCAKHGYKPYRYARQKYTTAQVMVAKNMMEEVLWPEFQRYAKIMEDLTEDILKDLTNKIHNVVEEELEIAGELAY
jgi:CRISPR/Cas system Type II protein with McrA/HNH and RuvC-like nuclease domain